MAETKQGETGPITKTTKDPDKKEFKDTKIEGTKSIVTCEDVIAEMRKKGKKI